MMALVENRPPKLPLTFLDTSITYLYYFVNRHSVHKSHLHMKFTCFDSRDGMLKLPYVLLWRLYSNRNLPSHFNSKLAHEEQICSQLPPVNTTRQRICRIKSVILRESGHFKA